MLGLTRTTKLREVEQQRDEEAAFRDSYETIRDTLIEEFEELPHHSERTCITFSKNHIAYKKVYDRRRFSTSAIATLLIPAGTKVVLTEEKHRVEEAIVLKIECGDVESIDTWNSIHYDFFTYDVGDVVQPRGTFDDHPGKTCTSGIHCFGAKPLAEDY